MESKKKRLTKLCGQIEDAVKARDLKQTGVLVKTFKEEIGLKSSVFARRLGASDQTVYKWVKAIYLPTAHHLEQLRLLAASPDTGFQEIRVMPDQIGMYTWDQVKKLYLNSRVTAIWFFSSVIVRELRRSEFQIELLAEMKSRKLDLNIVYLENSPAQTTFDCLKHRLKDRVTSGLQGQITGYKISQPHPLSMKFGGFSLVLLEMLEGEDLALISLPASSEEIRLLKGSSEAIGMKLVWKSFSYWEVRCELQEIIVCTLKPALNVPNPSSEITVTRLLSET